MSATGLAPACGVPLYAHPLFQKLSGGAWRPGGLALTRHGLALCGFAPGMRVADVGCGAGATLELLRECGLRPVGLDVAVQRAQDAQGKPVPLICAHAAHLPLAEDCLDGLVCECVLSLMQDAAAVLDGFARVLRPGGALLLSDLFTQDAPSSQSVAPKDAQNTAQSMALTEATPPPKAPLVAPSCADGALCRHTLERSLARNHLHLEYFEDHTALLKPLAAQLLWHGLACAGVGQSWSGGCGSPRLGYGLWVARKKER